MLGVIPWFWPLIFTTTIAGSILVTNSHDTQHSPINWSKFPQLNTWTFQFYQPFLLVHPASSHFQGWSSHQRLSAKGTCHLCWSSREDQQQQPRHGTELAPATLWFWDLPSTKTATENVMNIGKSHGNKKGHPKSSIAIILEKQLENHLPFGDLT